MERSRYDCLICGSTSIRPLSSTGDRSIASDLRILDEPLQKVACQSCGFIFRVDPVSVDFKDSSYSLYDHLPGQAIEAARQTHYATWLLSTLQEPKSIFEAGCGNGSLLAALTDLSPALDARGVEPSPGAANAAREAGFDVTTATLEECELGTIADYAVAINVVEHTHDPRQFLRSLSRHGLRVAVCCPDGSIPNCELLFGDHRWSFTPTHMKRLFADVGIELEAQYIAPVAIGNFFLSVGKSNRDLRAHDAYLKAWMQLDEALLERIGDNSAYCFGAGEAAALLRAYAPRTWDRVIACVVDAPTAASFAGIPIVPLAQLAGVEVCLLGVHPRSQPALATKLHGLAKRLVRWDDIIGA